MKRFIIAVLFCCAAFPAFAGIKEAEDAWGNEDYKTALKEYTELANKGDPEAQVKIGEIYRRGLGVKQDFAQSLASYLKSAKQNNAEAQYYAGVMYMNGAGVAENIEEGESWYLKAAKQEHFNAQVQLGMFYMEKGRFKEALKWLNETARQGHVRSIFFLGSAYASGDGVAKDLAKAYRYFHIASHFGRTADAEAAAAAQKNKDILSSKLSEDIKKQAEARAAGFPFEGEMRQKSLE